MIKMNIIELKNLSKTYKMGEIEVPVLKNINLSIEKGELIVIFGPSGCGKSTLLNMISGIDLPTEGSILVDGINLSKLSDEKLTKYRREYVGYVFQFYNLIPTLTALENVELVLELLEDYDKEKAKETLRSVGLGDKTDRFPSQLSGGEQQRVAIARAVVKNPKIVIADEPTGNIDEEMSKEIIHNLKELNEKMGITIVVATHDSSISEIAKRIVKIELGKISEVNR